MEVSETVETHVGDIGIGVIGILIEEEMVAIEIDLKAVLTAIRSVISPEIVPSVFFLITLARQPR